MNNRGPTAPPPMMHPPKQAKVTQIADAILSLGKLEPEFKPPRIVLNAVEGWGKTSTAAYAPDVALLMAQGETGYETLLGAGLVPQIDTSLVTGWAALGTFLDRLAQDDELSYKVLALDALGGFERLCHTYICDEHYEGKWGEKGFASYQRGYEMALPEWIGFLARLDRLRARGVTILLLGHIQIRPFKNPMGEDFDRYVSNVHHKTWGITHKWADAVFFGQFVSVVDKKDSRDTKGKGVGGTTRALYCERRDAFDAKNRYGLDPVMEIPNDPAQVWSVISDALRKGK